MTNTLKEYAAKGAFWIVTLLITATFGWVATLSGDVGELKTEKAVTVERDKAIQAALTRMQSDIDKILKKLEDDQVDELRYRRSLNPTN